MPTKLSKGRSNVVEALSTHTAKKRLTVALGLEPTDAAPPGAVPFEMVPWVALSCDNHMAAAMRSSLRRRRKWREPAQHADCIGNLTSRRTAALDLKGFGFLSHGPLNPAA